MKTAVIHSTIRSLARATQQFLLLALLLSSVAFGGGPDHVPRSGLLDGLPSQLDVAKSDHVALISQQDTLRAIKRLDRDDSADSPWLLSSAVTTLNLPAYTTPLRIHSSVPTPKSLPASSHTPRAPPALS